MEGTPEYLDYTEIMETFLKINGVKRVHNLRIWVSLLVASLLDNYDFYDFHFFFFCQALSVNKIALAAHLAVRKYRLWCSNEIKALNLCDYARCNSNPIVCFPSWLYLCRYTSYSFLSNERYHFKNVEFYKQMGTARIIREQREAKSCLKFSF